MIVTFGLRAALVMMTVCGLDAIRTASAQEPDVCRGIHDAAARSSCVAVAQAARAGGGRGGPTSVRSIVEPWNPSPARTIDDRGLAQSPNRYVGQTLLVRSSGCRYLDVNRYVCAAADTSRLEIHTSVIMPPSAQVAAEAGARCRDGQGSRGRPGCGAALRFVPTSARRAEDGTIVLVTPAIWVERRDADRSGKRSSSRR